MGKATGTESWLIAARGFVGGNGKLLLMGTGCWWSRWVDDNVMELDSSDVVQLYKYTNATELYI